jgi:hypothetical protein
MCGTLVRDATAFVRHETRVLERELARGAHAARRHEEHVCRQALSALHHDDFLAARVRFFLDALDLLA